VNLDELLQARGPERLFRSRSAGSLDWTELLAELLLPLAVRIKGMAHSSIISFDTVEVHFTTTPEPSPVLLVGSALLVIAAILRRRPDNEVPREINYILRGLLGAAGDQQEVWRCQRGRS